MSRVFEESARFFSLSDQDKFEISAKKSPHHRGYGLLKNYRDWREQIHFGVEADARYGEELAEFWGLWGPNLWPSSAQCDLKQVTLEYLDAVESLSRTMLALIAGKLGRNSDFFTARMKDRPYLLMKTMSYLPQEGMSRIASRLPESGDQDVPCDVTADQHMGVTAHCDWSWLTFLLQDDVGGLEAQDQSGNWHKVHPMEGSLIVNTGELLEIETGGLLRSSPHRVINSSIDRQRFSVPVFINPALDAEIVPVGSFSAFDTNDFSFTDCSWIAGQMSFQSNDERHVHKVIKPGAKLNPFLFGESEWDRKAKGVWCYDQACVHAI